MGKLGWDNRSMKTVLGTKIRVPDFQREYSWIKEQAQYFIQDLRSFMNNSSDEDYLFGQMIFYEDKEKDALMVIDGQQRLATSVIFLSVLREILEEIDTPVARKVSKDIEYECIGREGTFPEDPETWFLTLNRSNSDYFRDSVQRETPRNSLKDGGSNKNISAVKSYFIKTIKEELLEIPNPEDKVKRLQRYYIKFTTGFFVSFVTADEVSRAYKIFETLNSRGRGLEPADLIKNYFFQFTREDDDSIINKWSTMIDKLDTVNNDSTKYIRCCWNSIYRFTRKSTLFTEIQKQIKNDPQEARKFFGILFDLCDTYVTMIDPCSNLERFRSKDLIEKFANLKEMGIIAYYPIVLALKYKGCDEKEILQITSSLESLLFRNIIIGPETANIYEEKLSHIANKIANGTDLTEINQEIVGWIQEDDKFRENFKKYSGGNSLNKFILRELSNLHSPEMKVSVNKQKVQLEHIMPKNINNWEIDEVTHREHLNRLGNLTLLYEKLNSAASNEPFAKKKQEYAKSKIDLTHELSNITGDLWTTNHIEKRQDYLSTLACERWPKRSILNNVLDQETETHWREFFST